MQLIELKTFLAIIETGSLVKASQQLNVTQSTVTARLKSLEDEIGQTLINRQKSGATMTAAGERLRRYASTISGLWRQAKQEISLPDALSSLCNLGCHPDLWPELGSRVFGQIEKQQSSTAISVWHGNNSELAKWLESGLIDIALTYWPNARQTQKVLPLITDRLILVSTSKNSPVRFDPGYVYIESGDKFGREHAAAYADANTARISFGSAVLGMEYLMKNKGSAYLPERIARTYLEKEMLFKLDDAPEFERNAYLVINKSVSKTWPDIEDIVSTIAKH